MMSVTGGCTPGPGWTQSNNRFHGRSPLDESRGIYLEQFGLPRPHIGSWRVVSSAARQVTVSAEGYVRPVDRWSVTGDVELNRAPRMIPPVTEDDVAFRWSKAAQCTRIPASTIISVTRVSANTEYSVDLSPRHDRL